MPHENAAAVAVVTDPIHEAREVSRKARALQKQVDAVNARRREIIAELFNAGLSQGEIARLLDLSRQRITQYVAELREAGMIDGEPGGESSSE